MLKFLRRGTWVTGACLVFGLIATIGFSFLYTNWSIQNHAHQACQEMNILASAKGATTSYDQTVRREYRSLYALRCK